MVYILKIIAIYLNALKKQKGKVPLNVWHSEHISIVKAKSEQISRIKPKPKYTVQKPRQAKSFGLGLSTKSRVLTGSKQKQQLFRLG